MSKTMVFSISLFLGVYGGLYHLLTRPDLKAAGIIREPASTADTPRTEVIRETAKFLEQNPKIFKSSKAPVTAHSQQSSSESLESTPVPFLLGLPLNQQTKADLQTAVGQETFISKIGDSVFSALQDLNQAWFSTDLQNQPQREILLEMTNALGKASSDEMPKIRLLKEANEFLSDTAHRNLDYGGRALQYYANHETDPEVKRKNLEKMGIPIIDLDQRKASAIPAR